MTQTTAQLKASADAAYSALQTDPLNPVNAQSYNTARDAYINKLESVYDAALTAFGENATPENRAAVTTSRSTWEQENQRLAPKLNGLGNATVKAEAGEASERGPVGQGDLRSLGIEAVPKFSGDPKVILATTFLSRVEEMRNLCGWNDAKTALIVELLTVGPARRWFDSSKQLGETWLKSYSTLKPKFLSRFHIAATFSEKASLRENLKQKADQSAFDFLDTCIMTHYILDEDTGNDEEKITRRESRMSNALLSFVIGVHPEIRTKIAEDGATTREEMEKSVRRAMAASRAKGPTSSSNVKAFEVSAVEEGSEPETSVSLIKKSNSSNKFAEDKKKGRCFFCHKPGHLKRECYAYQKSPGYRPPPPKQVHSVNNGNTYPQSFAGAFQTPNSIPNPPAPQMVAPQPPVSHPPPPGPTANAVGTMPSTSLPPHHDLYQMFNGN